MNGDARVTGRTRFIVLMGVSGSGKTTIGRLLAERLGWEFFDGDDFHPPRNVAKMTRGIPLDDRDRAPWLAALQGRIAESLGADRPGVLACSALKERYRRILAEGNPGMRFVHLKGGYELIRSRLGARSGHYMKPGLLRSQFEALEEPQDALPIDIDRPVEAVVEAILAALAVEDDPA